MHWIFKLPVFHFYMVSGEQAQFLLLEKQVLYWQKYFPSPLIFYYLSKDILKICLTTLKVTASWKEHDLEISAGVYLYVRACVRNWSFTWSFTDPCLTLVTFPNTGLISCEVQYIKDRWWYIHAVISFLKGILKIAAIKKY